MAFPSGANPGSARQVGDNVEDIFNTVDNSGAAGGTFPPQQSRQAAPTPASAGVTTMPMAGNPRPMRPNPTLPAAGGFTPPPGAQFPPAGNGPAMSPRMNDKKGGGRKGLKVALVIVGALIVIGGGAFGVYWYLTQQGTPSPAVIPTINATNAALTNLNSATNTNRATNTNLNTNAAVRNTNAATTVLDTDQDGLTDTEESLYQTNPKLADTDVDGLNDYLEVMTYNTNPNNPDSDADTFNDGMEVNKGYNPNGPGRLIEIPAAGTTTNTNSAGGATPTETDAGL